MSDTKKFDRRSLLEWGIQTALLCFVAHEIIPPVIDGAKYLLTPESDDDADPEVQSLDDYKLRRGNLSDFAEDCRKNPQNHHPREIACVQFADSIRETIPDATTKLMLVNAFINTLINYDHPKAATVESSDDDDPDYYNAPQITLQTGKGICGDIALLKCDTAQLSGISVKDIKYTTLNVHDVADKSDDGHGVAQIAVADKPWILNIAPDFNTDAESHSFLQKITKGGYSSAPALKQFLAGSVIELASLYFYDRNKMHKGEQMQAIASYGETRAGPFNIIDLGFRTAPPTPPSDHPVNGATDRMTLSLPPDTSTNVADMNLRDAIFMGAKLAFTNNANALPPSLSPSHPHRPAHRADQGTPVSSGAPVAPGR